MCTVELYALNRYWLILKLCDWFSCVNADWLQMLRCGKKWGGGGDLAINLKISKKAQKVNIMFAVLIRELCPRVHLHTGQAENYSSTSSTI